MKDDNSREDFSIPTWLKWTLPSLSALAAIIEIAIYVREHTTLVLTLLAGVVYTLICFVLIYVLCSIEEIGGNIQGADSKTIWQYPLSWRVGAAIVLVLIVGCHSLHYSGYIGFEDRVKADSFRILVANLDAPRNEGYGITASILNQLRGETDTLTKVQVEALEDTITVQEGSEEARRMGKSKDADVVLWGWYRVGPLPDSVRATVQFEIVGDPKELKIPQRREDIYSTSTPRTFAWRLADEVQHVVLATLGYAHFNRGAISDAIRFYEKAIKSQRPEGVPNTLYFPHHFLKGIALQKKGKFAKSITSYDRALEIDSTHALAWNNLGVSQSEQGKLEKAITSYDRALEIDSTHALAWTNRGIAQSEQGKLDEAIASYNHALEIDSSHANTWYTLGDALEEQGKLEEAIESYNRALEIDSCHVNALYNRGLTLSEQGKWEEAIASYNQVLEIDSTDVLTWGARGNTLSEQGKLDEAIRSYNRALEIDSTHAMAWTNRGIALSEQGKLEEAIESYSRALEIDSSLAGAWAHRGLVLYEIGKKGAAVQNVDRACKLERTYCGPYPWEN